MSQPKNLYALKARKQRVEKEMKELYATRHEMQKLADKGSLCDQQNLKLIQQGLDKGANELKRLEMELAGS